MQSFSQPPLLAPIARLPNELIWSIVQLLDVEDAFTLSMTCRFFNGIMGNNSICRTLVEKQAPFSDECVRLRPTWDYATALRIVAKRHLAISNLQPFAAAVVAEAEVPTYGGRNLNAAGIGNSDGNGPTFHGGILGNGGYTRSQDPLPPSSAPPYIYAGQTLLYMASSGRTLRILPLSGGATTHKETSVQVRRLLTEAVPASKDKRNFHFRPLHYSDGIVSCVYVHRVPGTGHQESWLILFNPTTRWCRSHRLALPHHRLFVRNNKEYLVFGTFTSRRLPEQDTDGEGLGGGTTTTAPTYSGHRRWVLRHYDITKDIWSTKAIFLDNSIGLADLGSSLCFEVIDGYFYALANQQRYLDHYDSEIDPYDNDESDDEGDDNSNNSGESVNQQNNSPMSGRATGLFSPSSYYTCVRFPLQDPQRREIPTRASLWRRRNDEGAVDDRWTTLRLEKNQVSGQIMAVESRKEWLRVSGASSSRRTYYMQPLEWKTPKDKTQKQEEQKHKRRRLTPKLARLPENVHPGDDASRMMPLTLSRCGARVYSTSSRTFMDLFYRNPSAPSTDPLATPRLILRAGTRRERLISDDVESDGGISETREGSPLYPLREISKRYVDRDVVTWPKEYKEEEGKSSHQYENGNGNENYGTSRMLDQAKALSDVLNPPGYCGNITATSWDDRVLIYATTSSDGSDNGARQAIVVVSFDPTLRLPGLDIWGGKGDKECEGECMDIGSDSGKGVEMMVEEGLGCSEGALSSSVSVLPGSSSRKRKLCDMAKDAEESEEEQEGDRYQACDFQACDFGSQATSADEGECEADRAKEKGKDVLMPSRPSSPMSIDEQAECEKPSWVSFVEPMYRAIGRGFDFSRRKRVSGSEHVGPL